MAENIHLILIGGGDIGTLQSNNTYAPSETTIIDNYFVSLINKNKPRILFLPTATENGLDPNKTYELSFRHQFEQLGCIIDVLYLTDNPLESTIQLKLKQADAIYIGGGDPSFLLECWKKTGFDQKIIKFALLGKPIAGISAGANCLFEKVFARQKNNNTKIIDGLNLVPNALMPHWDKHKENFMATEVSKQLAFMAIDECAAVEVNSGRYQVITSKTTASAYIVSYKGSFVEEKI